MISRAVIASAALLACGGDSNGASDASDDTPLADAGNAGDSADASAESSADATQGGPDIDSIEWSTGTSIGFGVAFKDTKNPLGDSAFIAYGGYGVDLIPAELWATALYRATLASRGVRYLWAVQGPAQADYSGKEIGNSKIAAALIPLVLPSMHFVAIAAHSSGAFVGEELLNQLASGEDPTNATNKLIVYFGLDGGGDATKAAIDRLRSATFVTSHDGTTHSANYDAMVSLASDFSENATFFDNDATSSGCDPGADWCVHMTLINTRPHDPTTLDVLADYSDFAGRPVCTSYFPTSLK